MSVPIANPVVSEAAKEAVCDVLDSGMIADGEVVREFESEFAEYVGVEHAIATSSGTTALHAMFEAAGIGDGDVVLTSPFSFVASANAVVHAGAEPVFADIDPETYNLDPDAARAILETVDVDAIMPVHLYGLPAEMNAFQTLADEFDCHLFEDAAQAHGATYEGEQVGSIGDAAAFSFYPTKNMTTGEGGMITTDNDEIAARARQVINHGRTDTYEHEFPGYNFRMTNIQAAIGKDQLDRLPEWIDIRRENAAYLSDRLTDKDVIPPTVPDNRTHSFHQYTIRVPDRDAVSCTLDEYGVGYGVYYPHPIPDQPAYERDCDAPAARKASESVLSIPVHPQVSDTGLDTVADAVEAGLTEVTR
ncbi:DegT/DnrJ/EryC1/StrS family aminotransferase [Halobellus inordinatus]|uniref:DegT/DnrJ/EryC1/StrS family aminotransferase n=1 Tax=Halobellus inordinatus TaxID=1126236 RepID=UPI00210D8BBE